MYSDDEILDPNGLLTQEEKDAILEYRRTGIPPVLPYEELDFDSVGGVMDVDSLIEDFEKMCTQIFYHNNRFQFCFESIRHDKDFQTIINSDDYGFLKYKMDNLIELINDQPDKIYEDVRVLWDLI